MSALPRTIADAAARLRDGSLTSVELLRGVDAVADAHDGALGAYLQRFDAASLAAAERADAELGAGVDRGPLHGIPVGVKDILAMAEGPTTAQSLVLDPAWGAGKDAPVVTRLKAAGAVITGKLSTMEFAIGMPDPEKPFAPPRNPWDPARWAGGSSSGTGAAVGAGMVLAGVGTDTAGSIRIPAAFCGVTGLMPTYGRVPKSGCVPLGYSLDHIGPLARSAWDCAAFLQAIAGPDPTDLFAVDEPVPDYVAALTGRLDGVRIGIDRDSHRREEEDPGLWTAMDAVVERLRALGATVVEVQLPHYAETCAAQWLTMACEALAYHRGDLAGRWSDYFAFTRTTVAGGVAFSGADYVQAQRVRRVAQRGLAALFADVDLVLTPAASVGAPTYEELGGSADALMSTIHTAYWDAVGNPAIVAPIGFDVAGLPLALQLAARPFDEALLLRAVDAYQRGTDWHLRVPPLVAETAAA